MRRTYGKSNKKHKRISTAKYWTRNEETGEIKAFNSFKEMMHWYRRLSIHGLMVWSGWNYDAGYTAYPEYYQNERMF